MESCLPNSVISSQIISVSFCVIQVLTATYTLRASVDSLTSADEVVLLVLPTLDALKDLNSVCDVYDAMNDIV